MTATTKDEMIEGILERFKNHTGVYNPTHNDLWAIWLNSDNLDIALKQMVALQILRLDGNYYYLDRLGFEINEMGGWKIYQNQERYKRVWIERNHYWFWIGVAIAVASAIVTGYSTYTDVVTTNNISEIEGRLSKLDSQFQQLEQRANLDTSQLPTHQSPIARTDSSTTKEHEK
jgi:hypothetical protein